MRSDRNDVEKFLSEVREAIRQQNSSFEGQRHKNKQTLIKLGLLVSDVYEYVSELTYRDYVKGPEIDRDFPTSDNFWMFKKNINNESIYIKLKLRKQTNGCAAIVSFHIDDK